MKAVNIIFINVLIICHHLSPATCWSLWNLLRSSPKPEVVPHLACENFYEYACQNYSALNPDPNYNEMTQQLDHQFNKRLLNYLENPTMNTTTNSRLQTFNDKLRLYYESCTVEKQRHLEKYLLAIKPSRDKNWPVFERNGTWLEVNKTLDIWPLLGELQSTGLNNIVVYQQITRNADDTLDITLAPAWVDNGNALPDSHIMQVLLRTMNVKNPLSIIEELQVTESEWQKLGDEYAETSDIKEINFLDLPVIYPQLNLSAYFENLLGEEMKNIAKITLENPQYFEYLNQNLWNSNDVEKLCNYLMLRFLFYVAQDSTDDYTPLKCVQDVRNKFDVAVSYVVFENFFQGVFGEFFDELSHMFSNIAQIVAKLLRENNLKLSRQQVMLLQNKLKAIKINIGNLPYNFSAKTIDNYYRDVAHLESDNYYKNHLLLLKHRYRKSLNYPQKLNYYIINDRRTGSQSSPYYVAQQNLIVIPFANLQLPLFHYDQRPVAMVSLLGFIFAHELSHAFDTNGLNYDQNGFPSNSTAVIMEHNEYQNAIACMVEQEPTDEINERIADLFGIRVAYEAAMAKYLKFSDWKKIFFLDFAKFFCGKNQIAFLDHDSDRVRLQQMLMNFEEFSTAFQCREGTPMNPKHKCRLY